MVCTFVILALWVWNLVSKKKNEMSNKMGENTCGTVNKELAQKT